MKQPWNIALVLAVFIIGPWRSQAADADLPDDLMRVPDKSKCVLSLRVSKIWNSEPGKSLRKALGKETGCPRRSVPAVGRGTP